MLPGYRMAAKKVNVPGINASIDDRWSDTPKDGFDFVVDLTKRALDRRPSRP
jgi:hypothetical protein